ncbi:MAG TPA: hypothetical protein PLY93_01750 [Turneriella sp.]|nr:hypothetical protein [Turneriella sp.]
MKLSKYLALLFSCALCFLCACKSTGGPISELLKPNHPITPGHASIEVPNDAQIEAMREAFFNRPAESEELFRVFVTSDSYTRKQIAHIDTISLKEDKLGDQAIADEFRKFDMINSLQEGQIRVELYPTTGKFYRIRQSKPSVMKETDRVMSDDTRRWEFQFQKDKIEQKDFRISYQVLLRKKITREQAAKILSEQNKKR